MSAYRKKIVETKYMSFLMKDNKLLEKYNEIWGKVSKVIKKRFVSEPVYNEKYLKTKIKSYERKININFYNDEMPKEGSNFISLSMVLIDSVFKMGKNYYPQVSLNEYKYNVKEKEITEYINEDLEISSDSDEFGEE